MRYAELVSAEHRPAGAKPANRTAAGTVADLDAGRAGTGRFLHTLAQSRRSRLVHSDRRSFLRGSLTALSAAAAAGATAFGPARKVASQPGDLTMSGEFPYRIISGCDPSHADHNCRPGCGPPPTCNHQGCCDDTGWFHNDPAAGFKLLPGECGPYGPNASLTGDGWIWEYRPDLSPSSAEIPCQHCSRIAFRCHDGAMLDPGSGVWSPVICRTEVACDPTVLPQTDVDETVDEQQPITGQIESIIDASNGLVTVSGWVRFPTAVPIGWRLAVDGVTVGQGTAGEPRPDLAASSDQAGCCHGFSTALTDVAPGRRVVTLFGGFEDRWKTIATVDLTVSAPVGSDQGDQTSVGSGRGSDPLIAPPVTAQTRSRPRGALEVLRAGGDGGAFASGWAGDADAGTGLRIVATVDGVDAAVTRPDLPRVGFGQSWNSATRPELGRRPGFVISVPFGRAGTHDVCILAVDPLDGARHLLGCRSINAPASPDQPGTGFTRQSASALAAPSAPAGSPAIVGAVTNATSGAPGTITITGWAAQPADPLRKVDIDLVVNGVSTGTARADQASPALDPLLGASSQSGFVVSSQAPRGEALVELWAVGPNGDRDGLLGYVRVLVD